MPKNEIPKLITRIKAVSQAVTFTAPARSSEKVISALQKAGPNWTGKFANSWIIQNKQLGLLADGTQQPGEISPVKFEIRPSRTAIKRALAAGKSVFEISNMTSYANQAADLEDFIPGPAGPEPPNVLRGERENRRGIPPSNLDPEGLDRATAPLDWFTTYASKSGTMQSDVDAAFKQVFERIK